MRREFAPCPFCQATRHVATDGPTIVARVPARSPALPQMDGREVVLALVHDASCPRAHGAVPAVDDDMGRRVAEIVASARGTDAVPGELVARGGHGADPATPHLPSVGRIMPLVELLRSAIRSALDRPGVDALPHELSEALLGIACSVAEAADPNFLPPIFLMGHLPDLVDEPVAIGLLRMAYEQNRREAEDLVERERVAIGVEEARREAEADRLARN